MPYTDAYGNVHTDADGALTVALKAVCPENEVHTLTAQDMELLQDDMYDYYHVGDQISCGTYEVEFLREKASVSLNYDKNQQVKSGSYLQEVELTYPEQTEV